MIAERQNYLEALSKLPANPTLCEYLIVSLSARLRLLPPDFVTDLGKEIVLCQAVISFFQGVGSRPLTETEESLGSFSLAATRAFEGYVYVQEKILSAKDYPRKNLIEIIRRKMFLLSRMFDDFNNNVLTMHVIDTTYGIDYQIMMLEKKDFLGKAPKWLASIDVTAKPGRVDKYIADVITIEIRGSTCPVNGFVGMFGNKVYVFPGRRTKTRKHEWSHGLLRALELDENDSPEQRLQTALLVSPVKHRKLQVNGRLIEAGWHFEVECDGTQETEFPSSGWPFFCIEEADRKDE